jgi:hypothetical protein
MGFTEPDSAPAAPAQMPASTFDIQAPYSPGSPDPIETAGAADIVAGDVAGSVAKANAYHKSRQAETYGQGSVIGDTYTLPEQDFSLPTAHQTGYTGSQ